MKMQRNDDCTYPLHKNLISLKFEPVYSRQNNLVGYEALSRVRNKQNPLLPMNAESFFSNLTEEEQLNFFHHQVEFAVRRRDFFFENRLFISVNASATVIKNYPWLYLERKVPDIGNFLRVEVNENVFPSRKMLAKLEGLNEIIPVWLDDFSLSSFSFDYILHGHFDCIKVDKHIYWKLRNSIAGINYLSSFCSLLADNNKDVIFEGIENANDQKNLDLCGATAGQGWLWASCEAHELIIPGDNNIYPENIPASFLTHA